MSAADVDPVRATTALTESLAYARAPATPLPRAAPRGVRIAAWATLGLLWLYLAGVATFYVDCRMPDFEFFYAAGRSLVERGTLDAGYDVLTPELIAFRARFVPSYAERVPGHIEPRGKLDWYLPFVPRLMTLFAWMPYPYAGRAWLLLNLAATIATVRLLGREVMGLPPRDWPVVQLLPFGLLMLFWYWEFRLNQIDALTLLLLVGSFVCWQRGRERVAGLWLGLAVLLKVTPGLLVLWFALKRQWRTVGVALATCVLAGPVGDALTFRSETVSLYRSWVRNAVAHGSPRALILAERETDWRNQGLGAVLSRWLHPTNYNTRFDNDPRINNNYPPLFMNVAGLSRGQVAGLATAIAAASVLGLVVLARSPARDLSPWQLRFEWALFVLAMLWLMPVMRRYHMVWTLPAVSVLAAGIHYARHTQRRWWWQLGLIGLLLVPAAEILTTVRRIEAAGALQFAVLALAIPLVALLVLMRRDPGALPHDVFAPTCAAEQVPATAEATGSGHG